MKFIVIGGGTAGCISALMIKKKYKDSDVTIIESDSVGIVGVGESSTEHWGDFCNFVGINQLSAITHAKATFKVGVYFDKWADKDFMHCIGVGPTFDEDKLYKNYYHNAAYLIANSKPNHWMQTPMTWTNRISTQSLVGRNTSPTPQFQFDTHALNEMLHNICKKLDINIVVDDISSILLNQNGDITQLNSSSSSYEVDFVIDCSGFSRLILGKTYDEKWISYKDYLPTNSAITFATDKMQEYNKYTKCTAQSSGWSWKIPTQNRTGNGYVFCDDFINSDNAMKEMNLFHFDKKFKFDPGRFENAWVNNCFAVGLSQSFVEPLEATSIGSAIQSMFCFLHHYPLNDREQCNKEVNHIFDNTAEYVQAHYLTKREDTAFWKFIKYDLKLLPGLKEKLEKWKYSMPLNSDFEKRWGLFGVENYIPILYGLKWFDSTKIKEEFDLYKFNYNIYEKKYKDHFKNQQRLFWMRHNDVIKLILDCESDLCYDSGNLE